MGDRRDPDFINSTMRNRGGGDVVGGVAFGWCVAEDGDEGRTFESRGRRAGGPAREVFVWVFEGGEFGGWGAVALGAMEEVGEELAPGVEDGMAEEKDEYFDADELF